VLRATLIALGGALIGALYPAFRAARKDPIDALAYE
jgi:putative ABC transport system permease protein